jgi:hypothetical protein
MPSSQAHLYIVHMLPAQVAVAELLLPEVSHTSTIGLMTRLFK